MLKIRSVLLLSATSALLFALPMSTNAQGPAAQVTCKDGSMSAGGKGACSGKGGIDKKATAAATKAADKAKAAAAKAKSDAAKMEKAAAAKAKKEAAKTAAAPAMAAPAKPAAKTEAAKPATPPAKPSAEPAKPAMAKPAPPRTAAASKDGAPTAKCKDGSMSYSKTHTGACSSHGGVGEWLDGTAKKP